MDGEKSFLFDLLLDGDAFVASKTFTAPLERVRILIQTQKEILKTGLLHDPYTGYTNCFTRTYKTEGLLSFWRGNAIRCAAYFPRMSINYIVKDTIKPLLKTVSSNGNNFQLCENIWVGGIAGIVSNTILYSLDYAITRLAADIKTDPEMEYRFHGIVDIYRKTLRSDGFVGLYRGFYISCVGILIYRTSYFLFHEFLKRVLIADDGGFTTRIALGYFSCLFAGIISYPFDTVKRRMMLKSLEEVKYNDSLQCISQIVTNEGYSSLFRGVSAYVVVTSIGTIVVSSITKWQQYYLG